MLGNVMHCGLGSYSFALSIVGSLAIRTFISLVLATGNNRPTWLPGSRLWPRKRKKSVLYLILRLRLPTESETCSYLEVTVRTDCLIRYPFGGSYVTPTLESINQNYSVNILLITHLCMSSNMIGFPSRWTFYLVRNRSMSIESLHSLHCST